MTRFLISTVATLSIALLGLAPLGAAAADDAAAQATLKSNKCTKCHAADKEKSGPSFKKTAAKYKGKADAEQALVKSLTTGPKVKLDDGTEEEHTIIKTKDQAELKNLVQWILAH
jgi:cytochrome c